MIRDACPTDTPAIAAIYNPYIADTTISFEEAPVSVDAMRERIAAVQAAGLPWLVCEGEDGAIGGYAYATPWRVRHAYRFSVETSVYLAHGNAGRGLGKALLARLLESLREKGCHLAIAGIAQPNEASVALHEKLGFVKVAHFGEVGFKFGRWLDVGYWELRLQAPTSSAPPGTAAPPSAASP
ncbi:arsinothricin resistance N-acetyltransferase ArsN1 family B [Pseudoduganella lutea]|uniref:N-acetyltransferase family protein n=1 Tax=Pseudoduganella lutea TaxID=321985 RepID=A0A4P6L4F9_9BURK|nr:arsinothricin resistance N-acetyltransferase ArsN1 family B [Pseudoduganella lutea]QBE66480.1 N-acetyltransferase family protein [Pseudoduganella lutea]